LQIIEKSDEKSKGDDSLESPFNLRPTNLSIAISRENEYRNKLDSQGF
jgi:hypothetical protein